MGNRVFNAAVVAMWLSTMTWLVVAKVLPPMWVGDPPNYRTLITAEEKQPQPPVCWTIHWNERLLGWAASDMVHGKDGMTELHSRVFLRDLPLSHMIPAWLSSLVRPMLVRSDRLDLEVRGYTAIDPLGRLASFESHVRVASIHDAIRIQGRVEGSDLKLNVRSGDFTYETERYLPPDALVGDELSPQAFLPGLRVGQSWTMPVYSPLRPGRDPMEILQATVERVEPILWNNRSVNTHLVVYRTDPGSGLMAGGETRGKLWVRGDGIVLKQEISALNSRLHFMRLSEDEGRQVAESLGDDWNDDLPHRRGKRILEFLNEHQPLGRAHD